MLGFLDPRVQTVRLMTLRPVSSLRLLCVPVIIEALGFCMSANTITAYGRVVPHSRNSWEPPNTKSVFTG